MDTFCTDSKEVNTRYDLARFCNERGLRGRAMEVGVDHATFSIRFLEIWEGQLMDCIDPWASPPGYTELQYDREDDYRLAVAGLGRFADRVRIHRATFSEAWNRLGRTDWPYDLVYIDGDHGRQEVRRDIALGWSLLRKGGILAGHDFSEEHGGVIEAVLEFAMREDIPIEIIREATPSWYCIRPDRAPSPAAQPPPTEEKTNHD